MARKFQIRRGPFAKIPTLAQAEFGMTTDSGSERLFLGNGTTNLEIPFLRGITPVGIGAVSASLGDNYTLKIVRGDHQYINKNLDSYIPDLPTVSNYTHYVTIDESGRVENVLSIPLDYTDKVYYYSMGRGEWLHIPTSDSVVSKNGDIVLGDLETTGKVKAHDVTLKSTGRLYASMSAYSPTKEFTVMLDDPDLGLYSCLIMSTDKLMYMDKSEYAKEVLHEGNIQRLLGVMSASVE